MSDISSSDVAGGTAHVFVATAVPHGLWPPEAERMALADTLVRMARLHVAACEELKALADAGWEVQLDEDDGGMTVYRASKRFDSPRDGALEAAACGAATRALEWHPDGEEGAAT